MGSRHMAAGAAAAVLAVSLIPGAAYAAKPVPQLELDPTCENRGQLSKVCFTRITWSGVTGPEVLLTITQNRLLDGQGGILLQQEGSSLEANNGTASRGITLIRPNYGTPSVEAGTYTYVFEAQLFKSKGPTKALTEKVATEISCEIDWGIDLVQEPVCLPVAP